MRTRTWHSYTMTHTSRPLPYTKPQDEVIRQSRQNERNPDCWYFARLVTLFYTTLEQRFSVRWLVVSAEVNMYDIRPRKIAAVLIGD